MPDCKNCIEKCPQSEMAHEIAKGRMYATNEFVNLVKKIESGQLVEVVRCKDCICSHPDLVFHKYKSLNTWCAKLNCDMKLTGFCSEGKRRTDG